MYAHIYASMPPIHPVRRLPLLAISSAQPLTRPIAVCESCFRWVPRKGETACSAIIVEHTRLGPNDVTDSEKKSFVVGVGGGDARRKAGRAFLAAVRERHAPDQHNMLTRLAVPTNIQITTTTIQRVMKANPSCFERVGSRTHHEYY